MNSRTHDSVIQRAFVRRCLQTVFYLALVLFAVGQSVAQQYVTILYYTWANHVMPSSLEGPDVKNMMNTPYGTGYNWWGKPLYAATHGDETIKNNYLMYFGNGNTPNNGLIDYHADLLAQAGVDFITLDYSNGAIFEIHEGAKALCKRYAERKTGGLPIPRVAVFARNAQTLQACENDLFNVYSPDIFFNYFGKKLVMVAKPNDALGEGDVNQPAIPTGGIFDRYTCRHMWGLDNRGRSWSFKVNAAAPPPPFSYNGQPEQMCAPVACQASYMTVDGVNPGPGAQGRQGGAFFSRYMDAARSRGVKFVFICEWNEWTAINFGTPPGAKFVDCWKAEYSADIEPMEGGHGDFYYQLMKQKIAESRGSTVIASGHTYVLRARHSDKCAEVGNALLNNGANVNQFQVWSPVATCQKWTAYAVEGGYWKFINVNSGRCLEVGGYSNSASGNIQQWEYLGHPYQQWTIVPAGGDFYKIINRGSGMLMDAEGGPGATGDGVNISQYFDVGNSNQMWRFEQVSPIQPGTRYTLKARHSGLLAEVASATANNGGNVQQWPDNGAPCQHWNVYSDGGPFVHFLNANSNKSLEVASSSNDNGGNVQQWEYIPHAHQQWWLLGVDLPGVYAVVNRGSGKMLDVAGMDAGANIQQWQGSNGQNQQWEFTGVP